MRKWNVFLWFIYDPLFLIRTHLQIIIHLRYPLFSIMISTILSSIYKWDESDSCYTPIISSPFLAPAWQHQFCRRLPLVTWPGRLQTMPLASHPRWTNSEKNGGNWSTSRENGVFFASVVMKKTQKIGSEALENCDLTTQNCEISHEFDDQLLGCTQPRGFDQLLVVHCLHLNVNRIHNIRITSQLAKSHHQICTVDRTSKWIPISPWEFNGISFLDIFGSKLVYHL